MKLLLDATPSPVLEILLKWTVLLALGWAVHGLLRSKDARWRLILWRGIFCFGLALPVLQFLPLPVVQIPIHHFAQSVPETPRVEPVTMPMEREPSSLPAVAAPVETTAEPAMRSVIQVAETVSWQTILIAIWAFGGVCGAVRLVWLMLQLGTLKRRARPAGATIEALAHETLQRFRVRRFVRVLVSDSAVSPFVFGVFKPTIMLPGKLVESLTSEEILALLGHETAHLSHNDLFWCVGWRWMKAVFWFHPLIWHIPAAHNLACEEEADRLASGQMGDDASYPQLLARLALRVMSIPKVETQLTANGTAQITQRLRHLGLDLGTWRRKHTVAAFGIVLALVLVSVGCKLTEARESDRSIITAKSVTATGTNDQSLLLSGIVTDSDGKPVSGATVVYWGEAQNDVQPQGPELRKQVTTGTDGAYAFQVLQENGVLLARKRGLACTWDLFTPGHNSMRGPERTIVMTPPGTLAGVVVDESNRPISKVEVSVTMATYEVTSPKVQRWLVVLGGKNAHDCFAAITDADGRFCIDNFPTNATAELGVRLSGKALRQTTPKSKDTNKMSFRAEQEDIRLVMEPVGSIEGKIISDEANQPLPTARVKLQRLGTVWQSQGGLLPIQTAANGTFRIKDVPAGSYKINTDFDTTNGLSEWVAETVPVSVEAGKTIRGIEVAATRGGMLEVTFLGMKNRKPLSQIEVIAFNQSYRGVGGTSDSNGIVRLRLVPGNYQINAYRESAWVNRSSANIEFGKTNRVEIEIAFLQKISGIVRMPDGKPATDVSVMGVASYGKTADGVTTDASGRFELPLNLRRIPPNDVTMCLVARDVKHNLAAAQDVDEDTDSLDLKLGPALTLVGRAECDGKPIANVTARLVVRIGQGLAYLGDFVQTNTIGQYVISAFPPGRKYSVLVSALGYGQKSIDNIAVTTEPIRLELDTVQLMPANMKLAGQVLDVDDKPVIGCSVSLNGKIQPSGSTRTDREGRFCFEHVCEGPAQLFANFQNSIGNISAEGGDTNVLLKLGQTDESAADTRMHKLTGTVTDADGKPDGDAQVAVIPTNDGVRWVNTGTNGAFSLNWSLRASVLQAGGVILVARDTARNIAAFAKLTQETTNLDVILKPALTITGQVKSVNDAPLVDSQVGVWIRAGGYNQLDTQMIAVNTEGRYEIKCLPTGANYMVFARAPGYSRSRSRQLIEPDTETNRIELTPLALKRLDRIVAGRILDEMEKPVFQANVSLNGEDQPNGTMTTDNNGRFHFEVSEGKVRLLASSVNGRADGIVEAGNTNVVMILRARSEDSRQPSPRASLKGRPLPDLTDFKLSAKAVPVGKSVLLCLFDVGQRPSRYFIGQLNEKAAALTQKDVSTIGIQATVTSDETFNEWKNASPVSFSVGRVTDKSEKTKWASTVTTFPWLILADANHQVIEEGFPFSELDAQIQKLTGTDPNAGVSAATKEYLRKPKFRIDLTPSSHVGDNDPTAREDMPLLLARLANERYKGEMVDYVKVQLDLMWDKFPEYRSASKEAALRIAAFWRTTGQSDDGTREGSTRTNEIAALIWQTYHCLLVDHHPLAPEVSRRKATQLRRLEEVLAHLESKVARRKADLPKDALAAIRAEAQRCITRLHEYGGSSIWPLFYYPLQDAVFEKAINNMETDAQRNIDKYLVEYSAHRNMKWAELQGKALVSLTMGSIVRHYCLVERNLDYDDPTVFPFWKVTGAGCAYYMGSGLRLVMSID